MVTPAVVIDRIGGDIPRPVAVLATPLHGCAAPSKRSSAQLAFRALVGEAILHLDRKRAAERVQAVKRIVGHKCHPLDRGLRDQVPIHRVPEDLVDAHPVLIDR
jgi:hypothetical protein